MMSVTELQIDPGAVRPGILPFWFWNGAMADSEIIRQIDEMAKAGTGGFFISPRQGLEIPYLSSLWFQKVRIALEQARIRGLQTWIYDEYPYPSGMAGGKIAMLHPDAKHCSIEHVAVPAGGGERVHQELGHVRVLSALAVPVCPDSGRYLWSSATDISRFVGVLQREHVYQKTGLTPYNQQRFFTADPVKVFCWDAPDGQWETHFFLEKEITNFKYYGSYVDPCNEAAVQTFIRLTHERYLQETGDYFGTTIRGFYSDETGFLGQTPWSPSLPAYFAERNGYDLRSCLQALFCADVESADRIRYDYFQTLHLLLRERYHAPIAAWCRKHGLSYVSETPSIRATTQLCADIPASDSGHEKLGVPLKAVLQKNGSHFRYNPKNASSLSSQRGKSLALVECFHSVGWSMTLQDAKWMIDRFLALGVNIFNLHAFFYTTDDLRKHDAPPSQFFQNPYWRHFRLLADYATKTGTELAEGTALCSIAILDPVTSLWAKMGNPLEGFQYCGKNPDEARELAELKNDWVNLGTGLLTALRDFQHLDPEMLADAEVRDGTLCLGRSRFSVLVLPPTINLELAAWKAIKRFLDGGGAVIAYGTLPTRQIEKAGADLKEIQTLFGVNQAALDAYWQGGEDSVREFPGGHDRAVFIPKVKNGSPDDLIRTVLHHADRLAPPAVLFETGKQSKSFLVHTRQKDPHTVLVFITNQEEAGNRVMLSGIPSRMGMSAAGGFVFQNLDMETGRAEPVEGAYDNDRWSLPLEFGPYQSRLIRIEAVKDVSSVAACPVPDAGRLSLRMDGAWQRRLEDKNILRLDRFDFWVDNCLVAEKACAKPFINLCQEKKLALRLRYDQAFGTPVTVQPAYPFACRFVTRFRVSGSVGSCRLTAEERSVCGEFRVFLNGAELPVKANINGVCDLLPFLAEGENVLSIDGLVRSDDEGVRDALYLEGDFGVKLEAGSIPEIGPLSEHADFSGAELNQCPYYAGTVVLSKKFDLERVPEEPMVIIDFEDLDTDFHQAVELFINGSSIGARAWLPYEWKTPAEILRRGANLLELRVTTSLEGKFEGTRFDYKKGTLRDLFQSGC